LGKIPKNLILKNKLLINYMRVLNINKFIFTLFSNNV
jgi:hypothetical protein